MTLLRSGPSFASTYIDKIYSTYGILFHCRAQQAEEPWGALLAAFALVARHDPRPRVADAAANALLDCAAQHCQFWTQRVWAAVHARAVAYVLELPFAHLGQGSVVRPVFSMMCKGLLPGVHLISMHLHAHLNAPVVPPGIPR